MGRFQSEGVVLAHTDFGESDRIFTLFTQAKGKIRAVGNGARRSLRRFGGRTDLLTHSRFLLFERENRPLLRLEDAELIQGFHGLREDYARLGWAMVLAEAISRLAAEGMAHEPVFHLLVQGLQSLEHSPEPRNVAAVGVWKAIGLFGYKPRIRTCIQCQGPLQDPGIQFVPSLGGVTCAGCNVSGQAKIDISTSSLNFLDGISRHNAMNNQTIDVSCDLRSESEKVIFLYLTHILGKRLNSLRFIEFSV